MGTKAKVKDILYFMEIRKLTEDDLIELRALYKQFWNEESSIEKMKIKFKKLKERKDYIFLSAIKDNKLVGSALGIICEDLYGDCNSFMVVEDVIVDKKYRRIGIGTNLMKELEKIALKNSCNYIILITDTKRIIAQKFYTSLGYNPDSHKGFKKYFNKIS